MLPEYLAFVEGVVDSEDIRLNILRETVQSNRAVRQIQKALTGRVLKALRELADERTDDYRAFWDEFGVFVKQGVTDEEDQTETDATVAEADFERLAERFKEVLGDRVAEVRESKLLADHPCRLVSAEGGPERDLQRIRRMLGQEAEVPPRILEINRRHPLVKNLARLITTQCGEGVVGQTIEQLFDNLLLLEGLYPNPAQMVPRIQALLEAATSVDGGEF